jgi:hypothetical protein
VIDLSAYQGTGQFGPAYQFMLEHDAHAPRSVDRLLVERMVRLCPQTADCLYRQFTPTRLRYRRGRRPALERLLSQMGADGGGEEERLQAVCRFCGQMALKGQDDLDLLRFGGTEEELIVRGTEFCNELARVACVLAQMAALPARIVALADARQAYSGHAIIEVYLRGAWGAADPTADVIYRHADARPATTWELMNQPDLIRRHRRGQATPYTTAGTFRAAAISNYFVWDRRRYDYTVTPINDYYRSILSMAQRGWPGGLRWLWGEDRPAR